LLIVLAEEDAEEEQEESKKVSKKSKKSAKPKKKKDPTKPKRNLSSFMFFSNETRPSTSSAFRSFSVLSTLVFIFF